MEFGWKVELKVWEGKREQGSGGVDGEELHVDGLWFAWKEGTGSDACGIRVERLFSSLKVHEC